MNIEKLEELATEIEALAVPLELLRKQPQARDAGREAGIGIAPLLACNDGQR